MSIFKFMIVMVSGPLKSNQRKIDHSRNLKYKVPVVSQLLTAVNVPVSVGPFLAHFGRLEIHTIPSWSPPLLNTQIKNVTQTQNHAKFVGSGFMSNLKKMHHTNLMNCGYRPINFRNNGEKVNEKKIYYLRSFYLKYYYSLL